MRKAPSLFQEMQAERQGMKALRSKFDSKKISAEGARVHIGISRNILETFKVQIAAEHLSRAHLLALPEPSTITVRKKANASA